MAPIRAIIAQAVAADGQAGSVAMARGVAAIACLLGLVAGTASAQVDVGQGLAIAGAAGGLTDYVYRGISQTGGRPAIQGSAELTHGSGLYLGAFASNVAFADTNARQEVDVSGGLRVQTNGLAIDIGAIWYTYPGYAAAPGEPGLNYAEAILRLGYDLGPVTLLGTASYQPAGWGPYGNGYYLEAGAEWRMPVLELVLSGRVGYQWIGNNERFGTPDYLNYGIVLSRAFREGITAYAGWFGTSIGRAECYGGEKVCDNRFVAALVWRFGTSRPRAAGLPVSPRGRSRPPSAPGRAPSSRSPNASRCRRTGATSGSRRRRATRPG